MFVEKKGGQDENLNFEQDELSDLDDTYVKFYATIDILMTSFTVYETVTLNEKVSVTDI